MRNEAALLASTIANLCQIHTLVWSGSDDRKDAAFKGFEQDFCFDPVLQPFYTAEHLRLLAENAREGCIYEVVDSIMTGITLFRFHGSVILCGPYVKSKFNSEKEQEILAKAHLSASQIPALHLYYTKLPILTTEAIVHTCEGCLHAFDNTIDHYTYRLLHGPVQTGTPAETSHHLQVETELYSEIYARYELENHLQDMISAGDEDGAVRTFLTITRHRFPQKMFDTFSSFQDPTTSLSILRTLVRKAAERGGLSVIDIDRIMQETEQKLHNAHWIQDYINLTIEMIRTLAHAVRMTRQRSEGCSAPVRKCLEYIDQHYAEPIRLEDLASLSGLSRTHLSERFRTETGQTISDCIMTTRCQAAASMLKKTDLPIQEISSYVGYPDSNYFVKVFRRKYGCTPSAYRTITGQY